MSNAKLNSPIEISRIVTKMIEIKCITSKALEKPKRKRKYNFKINLKEERTVEEK